MYVCIYISDACAYCQRYCSCTTLTTLTKAVILCMPETRMKTYLCYTLYYTCMCIFYKP